MTESASTALSACFRGIVVSRCLVTITDKARIAFLMRKMDSHLIG